ncbi:hypothetical protein ASE80_20645 [Pseudomonas sp. Leaf15]|uniref:dermonecrotic toxin domain-containing protein n=1 Tax=unclassified Pseudomonas TaxID=196821 RepID=UPI0007023DC4|nr:MULTISPECIES: DUF6543 domain-containing protein [unclassified Pseudomonas]KQM54843.1 hypothetical protein ASE80_20645 [Pseudomonas sp. Leaf15]RAH01101.1 hypothetical protein DJ480_19215 [Pseudomonas sp. Leaf98]
MSTDASPYFFSETQTDRTQLSERQRARNFTLKDLDWFDSVYLATDALRRAQKVPMHVQTLKLKVLGQSAIELAGAFVMSPAPEGGVVLYTPARGLEKLESHETLKTQLKSWLKDSSQRQALLDYLSISQQVTLTPTATLTITAQTVAGAVFEAQHTTLSNNLLENARLMREELLKLPSFTALLDEYISSKLAQSFTGVDQRQIQVQSYVIDASSESGNADSPTSRHTTTRSLSETVLRYFVANGWPAGETRRYYNPQQPAQEADDQLRWDVSVQGLARGLKAYMKQQPKTFWALPAATGGSRLQLFTHAMANAFSTAALEQQQHTQPAITVEQRLQLQALPLKAALPATTLAPAVDVEKALLSEPEQAPAELAGTLIISSNKSDDGSPWLLYTPQQGLQSFTELGALKTHLLDGLNSRQHADAWRKHLARPERYNEVDLLACDVTKGPITGVIFQRIMEGIIEKQGRNLEYALDQYRLSQGTMDLDALVDHVLDVRDMIDPKILTFEPMGRWSTQLAETWTATATEPRVPPTLAAMRTTVHLLENVTAEIEQHLAFRPSLERSVITFLNTKLHAIKQQHLQAACLSVRQYRNPSSNTGKPELLSSSSMVDYFLARLCGEAGPLIDSLNTHVYSTAPDKPATRISGIDAATFNTLINSAVAGFKQYLRRTHGVSPNLQPLLRKAMEMGLTGEVQVRLWNNALLPLDYEVLLTVLGIYARDLRPGVNGFRPDAFALQVVPTGQNTPLVLNNCFVLTERGGLDSRYSGRTLLWTPALGLETFYSLNDFKAEMDRRLAIPNERQAFLANLAPPDWDAQPSYAFSALELIEDNLVEHLQRTYAQQKDRELAHILSMQLSAEQLRKLWQVQAIQSLAPTNVQRAKDMVEAMILRQGLQWLGKACAVDQQLYVELLEQYRNTVTDNQDYLHGIDSLAQFTHKKLSALLKDLDVQDSVTPDEVEVGLPAQGSTPARNQSLLDYALSHQSYWKDEVPLFASTGTTPLPSTLKAQTLKTRIQALNINAAYQTYLKSFLGPASPDFEQRSTRFAKQLPWQLMQYAHGMRLQDQLSPTAFGFIQQIMDMPDAIARATVVGANAMIRPLELLVDDGKKTIKIPGAYLIGSASGDEGPQVLYAPYSPGYTLKEYTVEAALCAELTACGALQRWVRQVIPAVDLAALTIAMEQPQASTALQLASNPINAALFKQLFTDNVELLTTLLGCQKAADAGSAWDTAKAVFSEGVQAATVFFAGKLAYPLVVWQSYKLFKASAEELQSHQWHEALGHFIHGVALLAGLSDSMLPVSDGGMSPAPEPIPPPSTPATSVVSWPALDITAASRTRLQRFEVLEPSLANLIKDTSLNLYRSTSNHYYAAVAGKVFEVIKHGLGWRIIGDGEVGPEVQRNPRQQWMLSSAGPVLTGRRAIARLINRFYSEPYARSSMNVLASGMREIRALYARESWVITDALALATFYAKNAQENLRLIAQTPLAAPELVKQIKTFFSLQTLEVEHLEKIQEIVDKVCSALMEPSLTSWDSTRFVIGRSRLPAIQGGHTLMAFTIVPDPLQLVYLTEVFFNPGLNYGHLLTKPFYVSVHARATTLIHEITHHVCETLDLAYVHSTHPFDDLIDPQTPEGRNTKVTLENRHLSRLSLNTPTHELFQVVDIATGLKTDPAQGTSTQHVLDRLLAVTGTQTLADARRVFRTNALKRILTVLNNADSVAYLIAQLGRRKEIPVGLISNSP